jgi:hypothetical protein
MAGGTPRERLIAGLRRAGLTLLALAVVVGAFFAVVRPWYLDWGATDAEVARALAGDALVAAPASQSTRAITIRVPVDRVWPWLAQLGQDRAGFYSFDAIENFVGCEMPVDDRLRPDRQRWAVGDRLWMYPPRKAGGAGFATLREYVPGRVLAFGTRMAGTPLSARENGSWVFVLEPQGDTATRVLVRGRGTAARSRLGTAFDRAIFEPVHYVMERRMLIGLQELAETGRRSRFANHGHLVLFAVAFVLWLVFGVRAIAGRQFRRSLTGFVVAALVFQWLTLVQPPLGLGALAVGGLAWLLWAPSASVSRLLTANAA